MRSGIFFLALAILFSISKVSGQVTGTIETKGDLDKFYPVTFHDGGNGSDVATELEIGRSSVHRDSTAPSWRGSLIARFRFHTYNWGNGSEFIDADIRQSSVNKPANGKFVAGWKDVTTTNSTGRIIIWLRGSTTYSYRSNFAVYPQVHDGVQYPLPYEQPGGPTYTLKTVIEPYVNQYGLSYANSAYFNSGNNYFAGNVGIGNDTPTAKLDVTGVQGPPFARFNQSNVSPIDAYLTIGNATGSAGSYIPVITGRAYAPGRTLGLYLTGEADDLQPSSADISYAAVVLDGRSKAGARLANANVLSVCSFGQNLMLVKADGSVGINATDTKGYKLAVGGSMIAERVKVKLKSAWPDYVFQPGYQLPSLMEVEKYIQKNQHLPEMPAAAEVENDGLDVGEMNRKLLQKVEELTLYLIDQQKQVRSHQDQIYKLKQQNDLLLKLLKDKLKADAVKEGYDERQ